jgi:hypothetical protein
MVCPWSPTTSLQLGADRRQGTSDPTQSLVFGKFEKPVAESKYIVSVKTKQPNWRNFLYFSTSMYILPAHVLKTVDGAKLVKDYNYK